MTMLQYDSQALEGPYIGDVRPTQHSAGRTELGFDTLALEGAIFGDAGRLLNILLAKPRQTPCR